MSEYLIPILLSIVVQFIGFAIFFHRPSKNNENTRPEYIISRETIQKLWKLAKEFESTLEKLDKATNHNQKHKNNL